MNSIATLILPDTVPVWYLFASILATAFTGLVGVAAMLTWWANRKKPEAEIHESRAKATRDLAEADEIRIRATLSLEDDTIERTRQMMRAQSMIFQLQETNRRLQDENRELRANERKQLGGGL